MGWDATTICSDQDVLSFRSDINSLGLTSCTSSIFDAKKELYQQLVIADYDPDDFVAADYDRLKEPVIYLALAYQYLRLANNSTGVTFHPDESFDPFERQSRMYRTLYDSRLSAVLALGLTRSDVSTFQSIGAVRIVR